MKPGEKMKKHRIDSDQSMNEYAFALGIIAGEPVNVPSIKQWEDGTSRPRRRMRKHIEKLTDGKVKADSWGK